MNFVLHRFINLMLYSLHCSYYQSVKSKPYKHCFHNNTNSFVYTAKIITFGSITKAALPYGYNSSKSYPHCTYRMNE